MVQKLNNIIQTKTKFNHKVDSSQKNNKSEKFEKSLEKIISDDKATHHKNQKILKKNKSDIISKLKGNIQNQNSFIPFQEKNYQSILLNNNFEKVHDGNPDNQLIFFNESELLKTDDFENQELEDTSDFSNYFSKIESNQENMQDTNLLKSIHEEGEGSIDVPKYLLDIIGFSSIGDEVQEVPLKDISEKIEAKLQLLNEFFQALDYESKNNNKTDYVKTNDDNYQALSGKESSLFLNFSNKFKNQILNGKEKEETSHVEKNENKTSSEINTKVERADAKIFLNNNFGQTKKEDENIQQNVDKNAEIKETDNKKPEVKIQFGKKDITEMNEKNFLNEVIMEHNPEVSTASKSTSQATTNKISTYNQQGHIRIQEFSQTTLQLIRATPENTTSTANLVLKPESLGTLFVQITMTDNKAKINIMADSSEAIKTLEYQIGALKEKLSQNGIVADSIDIGLKSKDEQDKQSNQYQFSKQKDKKDKEEMKEFLRNLNYLKENENDV